MALHVTSQHDQYNLREEIPTFEELVSTTDRNNTSVSLQVSRSWSRTGALNTVEMIKERSLC